MQYEMKKVTTAEHANTLVRIKEANNNIAFFDYILKERMYYVYWYPLPEIQKKVVKK